MRHIKIIMYDQIREDTLFCMYYSAVAMLSLIASGYLLFRRANAIAPDVMSPVRLRRWTAAFFACMTLSHVWYMPILFFTSNEEVLLNYLIGAVLDFMTLIPLAIVILLVMLQDRHRPLWPVAVMVIPPIAVLMVCIVNRNIALYPIIRTYQILLGIGLIIYMIQATKQYGHWLRDNYADLEHKEVWQSFVVLATILLVFGIYSFAITNMTYQYIQQTINTILICYLLWRVETLSDLSIAVSDVKEVADAREDMEDNYLPLSIRSNIGLLLKQHCEEPQLYLQHDISVTQLAKQIGTNRVYLGQYFSRQGTTYNAYINGLRIQHFINLFHENAATHQPLITKQLAFQSGFRSYSTFSAAFKQIMGTTATEWMRNHKE